jgi:hypothetical protein
MKKEISYFQQALELPNFQQSLLVSLIMATKEDTLESIALRYMETLPEREEYIPAKIELSA